MIFPRFAKVAGAFGVTAACVFGMAACSSSSDQESGGVAATVNGVEISEQIVTYNVQASRAANSLDNDETWGTYLAMVGVTPAEVREQVIDELINQELMREGAADLGITVDEDEVESHVYEMRANYESDEAWEDALERAGWTEDTYRQSIEESMLQQAVATYFQDNASASDEDLLKVAQDYRVNFDGAKRSSHILIMIDDDTDEAAAMAKANEILDQINSGSIDFADAAREYSEDTGSAENGGDVGWDATNSFVTEYTDALAGLELDEVSEPFVSEFGVHIVKVTEVYEAPEEITSLDQVPEGFMDALNQLATMIDVNDAYTEWIESLRENAEITVYDMPSGLPYDVDMSAYQLDTSEEDAVSDEETAEDADGSADVEGAADVDADADEAAELDGDEPAEDSSDEASN